MPTKRSIGRRLIRWLGRGLVLVVVLVTLAVAALAALTQTDPGRAFLAQKVVDVLNESVFAGEIEIDRLGGRLFGSATLHGVVLRAEDGTELASLDRADVSFRLRPLRDQRVALDRLVLDGLRVSGTIESDGSIDLSRALAESDSPPSEGPGWAVTISEFALVNGTFVLKDARNEGARVVRAEDIEISGAFALDAEGAIAVEIAGVEMRAATPVDLERLVRVSLNETQVTVNGDALSLRVSSLAVADTEVQGFEADVTLAEAGSTAPFAYIDVTLPEFVVQPSELNPWLGQDVLLAPLTVAATLEGPAHEVRLVLPVSGPEGSVGASLEFDLSDPSTPSYRGRIGLVRVRPGEWLDLGALDADVSAGVYIDGHGITPQDLELTLRVDLGPSRVGPFAVDEAYFSVGYENETITIGDLEVRSRGAGIDVSGQVARSGDVSLNLRVDVPDLAALEAMDSAVPAMTGSLRASLDIEGVAPLEEWATGQLPETLDEIRAALGPLTASGEVRARGVSVEGFSVSRLDGQFTLEGSARDPEVAATASVTRLRVADQLISSAEVTLGWREDVLTSDVRTSVPGVVDRARLRGTTRLSDSVIASRFSRLEIERDGVSLAATAPVSIRVEHNDFEPTRVSIEDLRLDLFGGRVVAAGQYAIASESFSGTLGIDAASLAELSALAGLDEELVGSVSGTINARGTLARPSFEVALSFANAGGLGLEGIDGNLDVEYAPSTLLTNAVLTLAGEPFLRVDALTLPVALDLTSGRYSLREDEPWSGRVLANHIDLSLAELFLPELSEIGLHGRLNAEFDLAGTPSAPQAQVAVEASGVRMTVAIEGQPNLSLRDAGAVLSGSVLSEGPGEARADLRLVVSSEGVERGNASLQGTINVDAIQAGTYNLADQRFRVSASLARVALSDLPEFVRELVLVDEGWVELSGIWNGALSEPTAKANVRIGDVMIDDFGPFSANAVVMAGDSLSLASRLTYSGQQAPLIDASALFSQSLLDILTNGPSLRSEASANVAVAPLALTLFAPFNPALAESDGEVELRFSLDGSLMAPQLEGFAALRDLHLVNGGRGTVRIDADYAGLETQITATLTSDDAVVGRAEVEVSSPAAIESGELVLTPWQQWPVRAELTATDAPMALLLPSIAVGWLLDSVDGTANVDVRVGGTLGDPALSGTLGMVNAEASVIPLQRRFERIGLEGRFDGSEITLEELRVGDADGRATASGRLLLSGLLPQEYELDVRFRDLFVADGGGNGVNLRGDVVVNGIFSDVDHQTNVLIDDMRVTIPDDTSATSAGPTALPQSILFVGEDVTASHIGERDPPLIGESEAPTIDLPWFISIVTTGENEIRHPYVTAEFEIDVLARIIDGELSATGAVTIPGGEIRVAGNVFTITRGAIRLPDGARELDPLVDIEAVHVLSPAVTEMLSSAIGPPSGDEATIRLRVTGPLSALQANPGEAVELYSDPPMDERDVFMVLATGRLSGDGDAAEAEQGFEALSNLLAGVLSDRISRGLFIDTLSFETTSESQRVEGGKYIADNLYISGTYIRTPDEDDDNNFEVALQWILRRIGPGTLRVELRGGDRAKGGLELLYQVVRRVRAAEDGSVDSESVDD